MLRDITIGQYYPADSVLHRLDPRTKLFGTLIFIISLFMCDSVATYAYMVAFLAIVISLSKVPFSFMVRGLKAIVFIVALSTIFNLFLTPGEIVARFWIFTITKEGIKYAIFIVIRIVLLVIGSSIMTLTTTPKSLTDGLERSLGFLKVLKVPVHEIAMMMSIALRFIPILVEETDRIMKAQMARGADFESGNLMHRIRAMIPILVPLFISAWRRAMDLATAMEARCYHGGEGRTKMHPLKYGWHDHVSYVICLFYLGYMIELRFLARM